MKLKQRQAELRLTDRELKKKAGVSSATVHRAKNGKVSRYGPMEQIASALECQVADIDEFHPALRERVFREAVKQGAPSEVLDQADQVFWSGIPPTQETLQQGAYYLLRDTIGYLDQAGRADLVDRAIRERK